MYFTAALIFFPMAFEDDSDAKASNVSPADRSIYYDLCVFLRLYKSLYATLWLYSSALHLHDLKGGGWLNKLIGRYKEPEGLTANG